MINAGKQHFDEDIKRALELLKHAEKQNEGILKDDVLRASWMMVVGACDAYFSDAYADLIARTLRAKDLEPGIDLPDRLNNLKVPVIAVIRNSPAWRWRMAARELIENENVLSLNKIRQLFNHFFRDTHKLAHQDTIESWIFHKHGTVRLLGISPTNFRRLDDRGKAAARKSAVDRLERRMNEIFQRRHDCIHNCDRPRMALLPISNTNVKKTIDDIQFLVERCHEAFQIEFPEYLKARGFSGVTRNRVCA